MIINDFLLFLLVQVLHVKALTCFHQHLHLFTVILSPCNEQFNIKHSLKNGTVCFIYLFSYPRKSGFIRAFDFAFDPSTFAEKS